MQIAGSECWICHQRVGTMRSGSGCERCQIVVHQACASTGVCPKCSERFLPVDEVHGRPSASVQAERDRPRSVTFLGRLALVGAFIAVLRAVVGVGAVASDGPDGIFRMVEDAVIAVLSGALGLGLSGWSRLGAAILSTGYTFSSRREPCAQRTEIDAKADMDAHCPSRSVCNVGLFSDPTEGHRVFSPTGSCARDDCLRAA